VFFFLSRFAGALYLKYLHTCRYGYMYGVNRFYFISPLFSNRLCISSHYITHVSAGDHSSHPPSRMHIVGKLMALLLNRSQRILHTGWIRSIYLGRYLVVRTNFLLDLSFLGVGDTVPNSPRVGPVAQGIVPENIGVVYGHNAMGSNPSASPLV
jgi:hypothetical protein